MTTFPSAGDVQGRIELLATFAHELRNRLLVIQYAARGIGMKEAFIPSVAQAETGALIERQVIQIRRFVDDLVDAGQWATGKLRLCKERADLLCVVDMAVETVQPIMIAGAHDLVLRLPSQPVYVHADPLRLAQVVVNLLDNAVKYSEPGGRIVVSIEHAAGEAVIRIADEGIGMPADLIPRVFDLFVQADHPTGSRFRAGLGIGLNLVKRIVELHSGSVEAQSGGPGQGSVFTVRIPADVQDLDSTH